MDVFGTEAPLLSDGALPPPFTLQQAQYAAPTMYPSPKTHRRHARGRLRKRNASGVQSRQRFEMVRWLPDRPLLHRPGGVACVPAGKPPCWLLAASGCWGQIAGTSWGSSPRSGPGFQASVSLLCGPASVGVARRRSQGAGSGPSAATRCEGRL